ADIRSFIVGTTKIPSPSNGPNLPTKSWLQLGVPTSRRLHMDHEVRFNLSRPSTEAPQDSGTPHSAALQRSLEENRRDRSFTSLQTCEEDFRFTPNTGHIAASHRGSHAHAK